MCRLESSRFNKLIKEIIVELNLVECIMIRKNIRYKTYIIGVKILFIFEF